MVMDRSDKSKMVKRIVLKVGTSTLTQGTSRISRGKIEDIALQIKELTPENEIILVSSGAIAAAKQYASISNLGSVEAKQALAAIGQVHLMRLYQEVFSDYQLPVSQCLLTYYDFNNEDSKLNIVNTINTLLSFEYIPIINENDTVATDEIKFGDNDKLAAMTAVLCGAQKLILASDIRGLYDKDPKLNSDARFIHEIQDLNSVIANLSDSKSSQGSGGMKSKLEAAQIAQKAHIPTWIVDGSTRNFLVDVLNEEGEFTRITTMT